MAKEYPSLVEASIPAETGSRTFRPGRQPPGLREQEAYMPRPAIVGWGSYVPRFQLTGAAVAATLGGGASRKARAVASYDEDAVTMAAAAARSALRAVPSFAPGVVQLATSMPGYLVKSSAGTVHAALGLPPAVRAADFGGATRSGITALLAALESTQPTLATAADTRTEPAGAAGELDGGDAAVAFLLSDSPEFPARATLAGSASVTTEVLDRWQLLHEPFGVSSDERSTEDAHVKAATAVLDQLFGGRPAEAVDILVVASEHKRVRDTVAKRLRIQAGQVVTAVPGLGTAGAANAGLLLAHALSTATAGQRVLLLALADGADALLLQVESDGSENTAPTVAEQVAVARTDLPYATYLSWRGLIERDTGRRPPLAAPAPMPALRNAEWKYALVGSRCLKCDTVHLPPERVCRGCGSVDTMTAYPVRDQEATVRVVTTDRLAWSPQPPLIQAVVTFDGGGELRVEIADGFDGDVQPGDRVRMSFRVLRTVDGIKNYFWKASPAAVVAAASGKEGS
jgi:3-hydroxy-3-methylglutaryl CoA synthase/uncharacterized OB-fold protein